PVLSVSSEQGCPDGRPALPPAFKGAAAEDSQCGRQLGDRGDGKEGLCSERPCEAIDPKDKVLDRSILPCQGDHPYLAPEKCAGFPRRWVVQRSARGFSFVVPPSTLSMVSGEQCS